MSRTAVYAGEETAIRFFNNWHDLIVKTVPAEKLVIYNVKEGWEPLAKMLDMEVPNDPFPNINDGKTITLIVEGGYYILVLVIPSIILTCCWKKSSKFRNSLKRVYGFTLSKPVSVLRSFRKSQKRPKNNNTGSKNQNLDDKKFDYIQYSNVNDKV